MDSRSPNFSRHAVIRAKTRFSRFRKMRYDLVEEELEVALLNSEVIFENAAGDTYMVGGRIIWESTPPTIFLRGTLLDGEAIEFVVDEGSGTVMTVTNPLDLMVSEVL